MYHEQLGRMRADVAVAFAAAPPGHYPPLQPPATTVQIASDTLATPRSVAADAASTSSMPFSRPQSPTPGQTPEGSATYRAPSAALRPEGKGAGNIGTAAPTADPLADAEVN
jgi:hypothetical protein